MTTDEFDFARLREWVPILRQLRAAGWDRKQYRHEGDVNEVWRRGKENIDLYRGIADLPGGWSFPVRSVFQAVAVCELAGVFEAVTP